MQLPSTRQTSLLIFLGCSGLMAVGYIMQYMMGLEPCPLCMTQRVFIIFTGLWGLFAFLQNPASIGSRIYGGLITLSAVMGAGFSLRQLYLQSMPADLAPACGPSIDYMFETFPVTKALEIMLKGDGNCAQVLWRFMGISIPGWTLVAFTGLVMLGLWQIFRFHRPANML